MFEGLMQPSHLLIILVIVLIIFGPGKLPELGKALGQGVRELRESASGKPSDAPLSVETQQLPTQAQSTVAPERDEVSTPRE
jgi:sec-independent protein translocase protein TatA